MKGLWECGAIQRTNERERRTAFDSSDHEEGAARAARESHVAYLFDTMGREGEGGGEGGRACRMAVKLRARNQTRRCMQEGEAAFAPMSRSGISIRCCFKDEKQICHNNSFAYSIHRRHICTFFFPLESRFHPIPSVKLKMAN